MSFDPVAFNDKYFSVIIGDDCDKIPPRKSVNINDVLFDELKTIDNLDTSAFDEAIDKIFNSKDPVFFITGKAGTGKSVFISYFRTKTNKNIAVVAPTGVAALNAKGETIHSFFGFPPRVIDIDNDIQETNAEKHQALDVLIIDEVSMVRADMFDAIEKMLRLNGPKKGLPFGGVKIILVGDLYQLKPIVAKREESKYVSANYQHEWFFAAHCFSKFKLEIDSFEFTKIFRQSDPLFIDILNNVRLNNTEYIRLINEKTSRIFNNETTILTTKNDIANQINEQNLEKLPEKVKIYHGRKEGYFELNEEKLPAPLKLHLKVGAQVMFLKNDSNKRWVNGTTGKVLELHDDYVKVEIQNKSGKFIYNVGTAGWEKYKIAYEKKSKKLLSENVGSYTQIPLRLAWAITIHKSQGLTFDSLRINLGSGTFAHGQLYVALSRCRSLKGLSLKRPIQLSDFICEPTIHKFYTELENSCNN